MKRIVLARTLLQLGCFAVVGTAATGIHWAITVASVELFGMSPAYANVIGWFTAMLAAFLGHQNFTFKQNSRATSIIVVRFMTHSLLNFLVVQAAYVILLPRLGLGYEALLGVILALAAIASFLVNRLWVFRQRQIRRPRNM